MMKETLKMFAHEIKTTMAVLENAFYGALNSPNSKDEYKLIFTMGQDRIIKSVSDLIEQLEKSSGENQ